MSGEESEINETKEVEKLRYKLNTPKGRSKLCFLLYLFIIPLFIIIGGIMFSLSELAASQETGAKNAEICVAERKLLMKNLKASLEDNYSMNSRTLQNFTNFWQIIQDTAIEIESCHRKRLFELLPVETFFFGNAMLYSFGVYTTIGYGNLFPHTQKGRVLTVVYAVIGIPLNIAFISDFGELLSRAVQRFVNYFRRCILNKITDDPCIEYKKFSLMILLAFLLTPITAVIVMEAERSRHWTYIDSLYYTFTTSTLIGLGDFTPQPSNIQFFVLMPLFFITETVFALAFGFITHLYRHESVIIYRLIKHKISKFLLHRRLQHMKNSLYAGNSQSPQELIELNSENDATKVSTTAHENIDAQIAELSAREMSIGRKIDQEICMLEAIPSQIDLGVLNAQMTSNNEINKKLKTTMKNSLPKKEDDREY